MYLATDSQKSLGNYMLRLLIVLAMIVLSGTANAADEPVAMEVSAVYIDVRTGPGRGYPVFHALERKEPIQVLKSRTDWFRVQTLDRYQSIVGWVHRNDLDQSLYADGRVADLGTPDWDDLRGNRWTWSSSAGDFNGAQSLDMSLGYRLTNYLTAEASYGQATGDFSDIRYGYLRINNAFQSIWRVTPYFAVGAGTLSTAPNTKLVQSEQRSDTSMLAGVGLRAYMTRNFFARLEYNQHLILTDQDTNEDVGQWLFGLSVSF